MEPSGSRRLDGADGSTRTRRARLHLPFCRLVWTGPMPRVGTMPDKIAAQRRAYNAIIALHNYVHELPRLSKAERNIKWKIRYHDLAAEVYGQRADAGIPFVDLGTELNAMNNVCDRFIDVPSAGVTQTETQDLTVALQRLVKLRTHYCDFAVTTNRTGYAVPPCPNCGSDPAANGNVDGVCPGCGEWLYYCGIFPDTPSAEGAETICEQTNPVWRQLPPSQVRPKERQLAVTPSGESSTDQLPVNVNLQPTSTAPPTKATGEANSPKDSPFVFARSGTHYYIEGFGESGHVYDCKGLQDIQMLIQSPNKHVLMLNLDQIRHSDKHSEQRAMEEDAIQAIGRELQGLMGDRERANNDGDLASAERLTKEIDALAAHIEGPGGLRKRTRDINNLNDRLRPKIHNRIKHACKRLRRAKPPRTMNQLAEHFELSISAAGDSFIYRPAGTPPDWQFVLPTNK